MGLRERVLGFISYKGLTNRGFERACGLSNGAVSNMGDDTRRATIDKISTAFPELNPSWLLTGEGEMLLTTDGMDGSQRLKQAIAEIKYREGITQKAISEAMGFRNQSYLSDVANGRFPLSADMASRLSELYPYISTDWLLYGEGDMIRQGSTLASTNALGTDGNALTELRMRDVVRYYPEMPVTAGNVSNMPEPSYEDQQPILYVIPGLGGCDAFPATGNSMYPTITAGDIVIHKIWEDGSYIRNGEIYVILTTDGQRMIKRLTYVSTDDEGEKHYVCRSDNPDQSKYSPFELLGSSIRQLSIVKGIMTKLE